MSGFSDKEDHVTHRTLVQVFVCDGEWAYLDWELDCPALL